MAAPVHLEVPHDVTAPVVVGCSGGADSLALLALAVDGGLAPIAVHVDHGLRPDSDREAGIVADAAARLGAGFDARRVTIAGEANLEARARTARYDALEAARVAHGATAVLVAHTADDQAETVLLNVLRGAAATGLAGMARRRGRIARPLLEVRRADTVALCASLGLEPLHDMKLVRQAVQARLDLRFRAAHFPLLRDFLGRPEVRALAGDTWASLRLFIEQDANAANSLIRAHLANMFVEVGQQLADDAQIRADMNQGFVVALASFAESQKSGVSKFVADQVKRWDLAQLTRLIEMNIGKDLQYIRFNGMVIGGLAGLVLYTAERLILLN